MRPRLRLMPFFSEDGGSEGGGSSGSESVAAPVAQTPAANKPLIDYNPLLYDEPAPTPNAPASVEELDFAGRKVPVVDPVIRDIHKDYSSLQKTFQETNLSVKQLQEQNQAYFNMIQSYQQQGQGQGETPQAQQPATEPINGPTPEDNEDFMNRWYDSPISTVEAIIQARVAEALKPMQQEREQTQRQQEVNTEVQTLQQKYADFQDQVPAIQEILRTNPQLAEQGLETVYFVARGQSNAQQAPTPTPQQLLNDPQFRSQLMSDEKFRSEVISNYMQNRTNTNQQVPPIMGGQPGGNAPAIPENRPTSIREASKLFAKSLGF